MDSFCKNVSPGDLERDWQFYVTQVGYTKSTTLSADFLGPAPAQTSNAVLTTGVNGWSSADSLKTDHEEWIAIDLGRRRQISRISLFPRQDLDMAGHGFPIEFVVETAPTADGPWRLALRRVDRMKLRRRPFKGKLGPVKARFVRVRGLRLRRVKGWYRMQLEKIEIFARDRDHRSEPDLALHRPVFVSSSFERSGWRKDAVVRSWQKMNVLADCRLVYVVGGSGRITNAAMPEQAFGAGSMIIVFPRLWYRWSIDPGHPCAAHWVSFSGEWMMRVFGHEIGFRSSACVIDLGFDEKIVELFEDLNGTVLAETPGYAYLAAAKCWQLIANCRIHDSAPPRALRSVDRCIDQAKRLLTAQVATVADIPSVAAKLHMSYTNFRRIFRQTTGLSPYQYILRQRITRAKDLMLNTDLSVKEVSDRLNFNSPFHFSKTFKAKTGRAPSHFKQETRGALPLPG
jgi:AraC-like DNA-binding protein